VATDDDYPGVIAANKLNVRICLVMDLESPLEVPKSNTISEFLL